MSRNVSLKETKNSLSVLYLLMLKLAQPANPRHCSVSWGAMLHMLVEARRLGASARTEPIRPPLRVHPMPPLDRDNGTGWDGAAVSGVGHVLQNNQSMSARQSIRVPSEVFFSFVFSRVRFERLCGSRGLWRNCVQAF